MRLLPLLALFMVAVSPASAAPEPLANVRAAVASPARDADNVKLDASRKPTEILRWAGLRKGMDVLDLFGANLYWSEILAPAVGPSGKVTIWEPDQFLSDKSRDGVAAFVKRSPNVTMISGPMETPKFRAGAYDFAMLNLNYHDLYWQSDKYKIARMDQAAWLRELHRAMRRGGTVVVIDHVADPGDTRATVEKFHRIDPATIRADFRRAGFTLVGSSAILRNRADDHSLPVFDAKVRGKTDRVAYTFRKLR